MLVTHTPPFNIFIENCNFIRTKKSDPVPYFGLVNIGRIRNGKRGNYHTVGTVPIYDRTIVKQGQIRYLQDTLNITALCMYHL